MSGDVTERLRCLSGRTGSYLDREHKEKKRTKKLREERKDRMITWLLVPGLYGAVFAREMENAGKRCLVHG